MYLRLYRPEDLESLTRLFFETIHTVNAGDYTPEQLWAWAPGAVDAARWDHTLREHHSLVALDGDLIIGFGDMDGGGYLDRLFVHRHFQSRGTATALCDALERHAASAGVTHFTTHASITARPFFSHRGYRTLREQQVVRRGVLLTNFVMEKSVT